MRTFLAGLVLLLTSCLPSTKAGWYANPGLRSEGLCHWTDAEWHDTGVLLAPQTVTPMARVYEAWGHHGAWRGAKVSGVLRRAGPYVLFEGKWRGDGLVLEGEVDASERPMLKAYTTARAGPACILPRGADVLVLGRGEKALEVMPPLEAMEDFVPAARPTAEMACEALTLYPQDADPLQWSGFDKDAPTALLTSEVDVPAYDAPGGALVGRFKGRQEPLWVHRLEVRGDQAHVAAVHDTGVVWPGWVAAAVLKEPEKYGLSNIFGYGGLGAPSGAEETWLACAVEHKLYARLATGPVVRVGRVLASTPFRPGEVKDGYVAVSFRNRWLIPEDGVSFVLEAAAAACSPWIPPPTGPVAPAPAAPPTSTL